MKKEFTLKKCTIHKNVDSTVFCKECQKYFCYECEKYHSIMTRNHHLSKTIKNVQIFPDICEEHLLKLDFYCNTHNKLVCAACISTQKELNYGSHNNCDVKILVKIAKEKKNQLNEILEQLENGSKNIEEIIHTIKLLLKESNVKKEQLKSQIEKLFTKIISEIHNRKKKLMEEIDKKFSEKLIPKEISENIDFFSLNLIKSIEYGRQLSTKWEKDKLSENIQKIIFMENNLKIMNSMQNKLKKFTISKSEITYSLGADYDYLTRIKNFCKINSVGNFSFKSQNQFFNVTGPHNTIATMKSYNWKGIITDKILPLNTKISWIIQIHKSVYYNIMIGVAPYDFDINSSTYNNYGWYFHPNDSSLYSGPPHNFSHEQTDFMKKEDFLKISNEIKVIMDTTNGKLSFGVGGEEMECYTDIPLDKFLLPVVIMYDTGDVVEIVDA